MRRVAGPLHDVRDALKRPVRRHDSRHTERMNWEAGDAPASARAYPRWLASLVARHGRKRVADVDFEPDTSPPSESVPTDPQYVARIRSLIDADRSAFMRRSGGSNRDYGLDSCGRLLDDDRE